MSEDAPQYDTQQQSSFERGYQIREHAASYQVAVPLLYIDLCDGNMYDAILFAQIMYWHGKSKTGKPRLRVRRDG